MSRGALRAMFRPYVEFDFTRMAFDTRVSFSRSSIGTYFDAAGVMQTVASNVPRKEHNPVTGAVRGLLLEEQRTNLLVQSSDISSASWAKSGIGIGAAPVVTANYAAAPDGTITACRVQLNLNGGVSSSDQSRLAIAATTVASTGYTGSIYVKATSPADVGKVILFRHVGNADYVSITLTASYQRVSVVESAIGTSSTFQVLLRGVLGGSSDTADFLLWGCQLEAGSYPTSYIPTTTAAVTRAADVATFTIPPRVVRLVTIYDDGTTSQQTVTPGASYTIPTGQKPILRIRGYFA